MASEGAKDRSDWVAQAAAALVEGGWESVRVEPLARRLGVTKGSFYWHFKDRRALLDAVIEHWEQRGTLGIIDYVDTKCSDPEQRLRLLWQTTNGPGLDMELAIRDLARRDAATASAVERVDSTRVGYLRRNFRQLGLCAKDAEARSLLVYSLLIGDYFIAPCHGRLTRRSVLDHAFEYALAH